MLSNTPIVMQHEEKRETTQQPSSPYSSSPARLHSTVLQTMAPHVQADAKARKMTPDRPKGQSDQSSIIIHALRGALTKLSSIKSHKSRRNPM